MLLTIHNRALLRGVLAGAVILGGVSACSRSDRADAGRDTTQTGTAATPADTQASGATQPAMTDTAVAPARDTTAAAPPVGTSTPEAESNQAAAEPKDSAAPAGDQGVSGYQAMGHDAQQTDTSVSATPSEPATTEMAAVDDTTQVGKPGERLEPTETTEPADADTSAEIAAADTATTPDAVSDTTAAGYEPMARDTSVALAQGDTGQVQSDTVAQWEADTAAAQVQADTTTEAQTELAVEDQPDTVTVVGDSSSVDKPGPRAQEDTVSRKADSLAKYHDADPVRPAEDSTAVLGQVTEDQPNYDVEAIGDANGEPVGAAQVESTGNIATGADAVALMTREGQRCRVEDSSDAQWDLAGSPTTLNPCGSGTMTLPKVQTGEKK
jgi:hypothetical protein